MWKSVLNVLIYLKLYGRYDNIKKINDLELEKISGGSVEWIGIGLGIAALVVFLSGVFEGYTNPGRCG